MGRPRKTTTQRGYGAAHKKLRKHYKPLVATGQINCARCGQPINPQDPWDLGHTDDRTSYHGPEHQACNRATNGRERQPHPKHTVDTTRTW